MNPGQRGYDSRIAGVYGKDYPLQRTRLAILLSAQIFMFAGIEDLAQAENMPSNRVVSACRSDSPRAAFGEIPKASAQIKKSWGFAQAAIPFMSAGEYDLAIEQFDQAIDLAPIAPFYLARGRARSANRQRDEALADLNHAIALDPTSSVAFFERGNVRADMDEYDQAIEAFDEAIKLFSGNVRAYLNRGTVYLYKREYDRAVGDIDEAVKLDPFCPLGLDRRGLAYELKGEHDRAVADYDRAIELDPNPGNATAFIRRAGAYRGKRDYDRAIQDLSQALKLEPESFRALNGRCIAQAMTGAFDRRCRIATRRCGSDQTMPTFSIAAGALFSKWARSTTPSPSTTPHFRLTRKWQFRCTGAVSPSG